MVVSYTTCDDIIGRVIRNTRLQDTSYILDMPEWIGEAMEQMQTKVVLHTRYKDLRVYFHKAKVPAGTIDVKAVEYNGHRLPFGNDIRAIETIHEKTYDPLATVTTGFVSLPLIAEDPEGNKFYDSTALPLCTNSLDVCNSLPYMAGHWYNLELGYINTSMKEANIRVHYTAIPVDEKGLPLIPDHGDYKVALYYYIRKMMIGAGYEDKVFKWEQLHSEWEIHARRAINDITYPDVNQMEVRVNNMSRLVPDEDWFSNFFSSPLPEKQYGDMSTAITPWTVRPAY